MNKDDAAVVLFSVLSYLGWLVPGYSSKTDFPVSCAFFNIVRSCCRLLTVGYEKWGGGMETV